MRISDWSSDVCSSDLAEARLEILETPHLHETLAQDENGPAIADHRHGARERANLLVQFVPPHRNLQPPCRQPDRAIGFEFDTSLSRLTPRWKPEVGPLEYGMSLSMNQKRDRIMACQRGQ